MTIARNQKERRQQTYALHREAHRRDFASDGSWVGRYPREGAAYAREWLWHAMAFLDGDAEDVRLGNAIVAATPNVLNHFNPVAAAHLLLRYPNQLNDRAREHLLTILRDGIPEAIDFALSVTGVNNFSSMRAFLFLAASELIETYEATYKHRSIPEVYNRYRLRQFGLNLLQLMEDQLARTNLAQEFNSPTYSPITLLGVAEIANLIHSEEGRAAAARIEDRLWKELLAFHHPLLAHVSGPHSRGYTVDSVGHASNWKILCCFLGLDGTTAPAEISFPALPGQLIHAEGDLTAQHAIACWLIRPDYHVPENLLSEFRNRKFPCEFRGSYEWPGMGYRRPDGKVILNVEGDYKDPGGRGIASCYQTKSFSIGSMSRSYTTLNHPCQIVYRLDDENRPLGSARSITTVMLTRALAEWVVNPLGERVAPTALPNNGDFRLQQDRSKVSGTVQPYHWAPHYGSGEGCDEISLNLFITEHLPPGSRVRAARLDGEPFNDRLFVRRASSGTFEIEDGAIRVVWNVQTEATAPFQIFRHGGFLRCAVILYQGQPRMFEPEELARFRAGITLSVSEGQ